MALIKSGEPALALIRALGVTDTTRVRRVTLNVEAGKVATLEVERYVDSGATTKLEQLELRAEAPAELIGSLAKPGAES